MELGPIDTKKFYYRNLGRLLHRPSHVRTTWAHRYYFFLLSQLGPIRHVLRDQLWAVCFGAVGLGLWVEPVARSIAQMAKDFPRICFNCKICILLTQIMYPPNRNSVSFRMKTSFLKYSNISHVVLTLVSPWGGGLRLADSLHQFQMLMLILGTC